MDDPTSDQADELHDSEKRRELIAKSRALKGKHSSGYTDISVEHDQYLAIDYLDCLEP
jgi:hypothetical protein